MKNKQTMRYKGYDGSIEISIEDNCLFGKILFIEDCILYDGETLSEIKNNFEQAVEDYLLICKAENLEPNKPFKGSFNVRTTPEIHKALSLKSYQLGVSMNVVCNNAFEKYLHHEVSNRDIHENINSVQKKLEIVHNMPHEPKFSITELI